MSNVFTAVGRLCTDPQTRFTADGQPVTGVRMAFDSGRKGKDDTVFMDATLWGKRGEAFAQYMTKGRAAFMSGALSSRKFTGRDGGQVERIELTVNEWSFVPRDAGAGDAVQGGAPLPPARHIGQPRVASNPPPFPEGGAGDDDNIPF